MHFFSVKISRLFRVVGHIVGVICIVGFCSSGLLAQGSPYNMIGFGEPVVTQSARLEGIAGAGVAVTESRMISDMNPAAWSMMTRARIEARLGFSYSRTDFGVEEGVQRQVKFTGFNFATPIWDKQNVGFAIGFAPITNADAATQQVDSIGTTIYRREGGLSQLYLGLSTRVIPALFVGARADFLFGNLRTVSQADVSQGLETIPGVFQREYALSGTRGTFGFLLTLDTLLPELRGLTIGGSYSTGAPLTSKQRTVVTPANSLLDSTIEKVGFGSYPSSIRLGIATRIGDRYRLEADIAGQDFSASSFYSPTNTIAADPYLGSSNRYSFGFERLPIMGDEGKGFSLWEKMGVRFGFSYASLPFRPDTKMKVNELSFHGGLGIPLNLESLFDLSATIGLRNPEVTGGAPKDFYFKVGGAISLSEKWLVPLRRDDE